MNIIGKRHKFWLVLPFLTFFILMAIISYLNRPEKTSISGNKEKEYLDYSGSFKSDWN